MTTILLFGFLIGMRHALEADHVAAIASLAARSQSLRDSLLHGAIWGVGHTLTIFVIGSVVLFTDLVVPDRMAAMLELSVGVMLVLLGLDVLRRLMRDKIHLHVHTHKDGSTHFHAHGHRNESGHDLSNHAHELASGNRFRALYIGLMHGMAGSAALIVLTLSQALSPLRGLGYIALFGIGSIVGMALLSVVISVPLRESARRLTWLNRGLQGVVGSATVVIGALLIVESGLAAIS